MPLSDDDKKEIAKLISEGIAAHLAQPQPAAAPGVEIRHVGIPIDTAAMGKMKRPPMAADQCCNGCD
jgi:hypothetical protein